MKAKKFLKSIQLKNRQRAVDKKFDEEGLTDEVLNEQLEINQLRHQYDISDKSNRVYKNFVQ